LIKNGKQRVKREIVVNGVILAQRLKNGYSNILNKKEKLVNDKNLSKAVQ